MKNKHIFWMGVAFVLILVIAAIFLYNHSDSPNYYIKEPLAASVTNFEVYQVPEMSEPQPRVPYKDQVFGTYVVRITDRKNDVAADDLSKGMKNEYSRVQSFNANEEYF